MKEAALKQEQLLNQIKQEQQRTKELALALEKERDTLKTIIESTNALIAFLDSEFNFIMINSAYEKGSGHTEAKLIGRNHFDLFPNPENEAIFKKVRDTGETIEFKAKPFEYADQPWRGVTYWDWTLTPIKDSANNVIGLVLSLLDVTDIIRAKQLSDALNDINTTINSTLDIDTIIERSVKEATKAMGSETAGISLREGDNWVAKYFYGLPKEFVGTRFTDEQAPITKLAVEAGKAIAVDNIYTDERVNRGLMEFLGIKSFLTTVLRVKETVIGVLTFHYHSAAVPFTEVQIDFSNKLAASISLALENARLYEAEHHIADTLQTSLLTMPEHITGITYGYLYRSATEAAKLGGDFYDIFELEHGKIGIVIGDVSGKGIEATALGTIAKNTLKAHAYENSTPALTMSKTNHLVTRVSPRGSFVSVFFGVLDMATGRLNYCNAGHPEPIVKRTTGIIEPLDTYSPAIGAFQGMRYRSGKITLDKGDTIVLYTDGITEARCDSSFYGEERLADFIKGLDTMPAKEIPRAIFNEVERCAKGKLSDDIALLTVSLEATFF